MFKPFTLDEGRELIKIVRTMLKQFVKTGNKNINVKSSVLENNRDVYGIVVTFEKILHSYFEPIKFIVRGSAGFVKNNPINLHEALKEVVYKAAYEYPNRSPIYSAELDSIRIELMLISKSIKVNFEELENKLILGYHIINIKTKTINGVKTFSYLPHKQIEYASEYFEKTSNKMTTKTFIEYVVKDLIKNDIIVRIKDLNMSESLKEISKYITEVQLNETQIFYELDPRKKIVIERKLWKNKYLENNPDILKQWNLE